MFPTALIQSCRADYCGLTQIDRKKKSYLLAFHISSFRNVPYELEMLHGPPFCSCREKNPRLKNVKCFSKVERMLAAFLAVRRKRPPLRL